MRKVCLLGVVGLLIGFATSGAAQSTRNVFPQIVDGAQSDGTYYLSALVINNLSGATAVCTLATVGLPVSRFVAPATVTLPNGETLLNLTSGPTNPLAVGYGILDCTQAVQASVVYVYKAMNGTTLGMAAVFSAPPVTYASIPVLSGETYRFGIAIANTGPTAISVELLLTTADGTTTGKTIQVAPASQMAKFVDEVLTVPSTIGTNILEVVSSSPFNITGLMFDGQVFTTLVPATLP